ncbi:MAG: GreA/GreB family elongation factor [Bryobacterales bacterium]
MQKNTIHITEADFDRLERLVDGWWAQDPRTRTLLDRLQEELDRARVVDNQAVAPGCVTLGSEIMLRDLNTGELSVHRLALPNETGDSRAALSILSPVGIAVLGYGEGDEVDCETPGGRRRLRVEKVLFQPEADLRNCISP